MVSHPHERADGCRGSSTSRSEVSVLPSKLLREIGRFAQALDERKLRLDPVDVSFLAREHAREHGLGRVVALVATQGDAVVEALYGGVLHLEIALQLLDGRLADVQAIEPLEVRQAFEEEDAG